MTKETCKPGDRLDWPKVPNGAMVLRDVYFYVRAAGRGTCVGMTRGLFTVEREGSTGQWSTWSGTWPWAAGDDTASRAELGLPPHGPAVVIACDLDGSEDPAVYKRAAEVAAIEEALRGWTRDDWREMNRGRQLTKPQPRRWYAERLHAGGWKPGDTVARAREVL